LTFNIPYTSDLQQIVIFLCTENDEDIARIEKFAEIFKNDDIVSKLKFSCTELNSCNVIV
jgi:hypothetical protein